jgi:hypothetical protein
MILLCILFPASESELHDDLVISTQGLHLLFDSRLRKASA